MSPDQMRALLAQQQAALASLQTKLDEQSQKAYTEKYAAPAALSASQATNPLDGLDWQDARNQGGDNFT